MGPKSVLSPGDVTHLLGILSTEVEPHTGHCNGFERDPSKKLYMIIIIRATIATATTVKR